MIYVILGQTASGKTGVSLELCRKFNLPLIGADTFQMYQELNIGSAKPTKKELEGIDYHLINDISVTDKMSVMEYQRKARALLDKYIKEGQDIILSGGTFLYVRAALYPYEFKEEREDNNEEKYSNFSNEELYQKLVEVDKESADILHPNNRRRVIRALEIFDSGVKKSDIRIKKPKLMYPCKFFMIDIDKDEGNEKINARVDEMVEKGLFDEVDELIKQYDTSSQAFEAIGYKEIIRGIKENKTREEIIEEIKLDTRQYAKRQRTFLRHQFENIHIGKKQEIEEYISYDIQRRKRNKASIDPLILARIEKSKVALIGVGGVGSIVASSLLRLGVSNLTLIDKDVVDVSNLNRQIIYDKDDIGLIKVEQAKKHLHKIDPHALINVVADLYSNSYLDESFDFVFDCIDDVDAKCEIYKFCKDNNIKVIHATGSGLRIDSTKFVLGTLNETSEPLSKKFKRFLKEKYGGVDLSLINVAYSKETNVKRRTEYIGSNVSAPNGEGLAMISYFIRNI